MRTATCGSGDRPGCGEPILWVRHERTKKLAPIDVAWNTEGNVVLDRITETYSVLFGPELAAARERGAELHLNHFSTCPLRQNFGGDE